MKKLMIMASCLLLATLQSCSTEDTAQQAAPQAKAGAEDFKTSLATATKLGMQQTNMDREQANRERVEIMVKGARTFLLANGYTQSQLQDKDEAAVLNLAFEMYFEENQTNN
ncbi:hypothetical protein GR160_13240 [Flavobacterium sp. Sd200]|uniref:hypothetical protein n=1 Tax=Flavobacterium sp. Sd200 TaxID=2692211 RepID=UPI00136ACB9F|nr:hypothetical protein [Flavobacterium sp. Sd200]MXN92190.1 hypothetical protein [Flavobacterium sp. Sd200]